MFKKSKRLNLFWMFGLMPTVFISVLDLCFVDVALAQDAPASKPVCETTEDCDALRDRIDERVWSLLASKWPNIGDVVLNEKGNVHEMNQADADKYCKAQGTRLPTAREYTIFSQAFGTKSLRETAFPNVENRRPEVFAERKKMLKEGYTMVGVENEEGVEFVDFYFSLKGYHPPFNYSGRYNFWTSTRVAPSGTGHYYYFVGSYGYVALNLHPSNVRTFAVRCIKK